MNLSDKEVIYQKIIYRCVKEYLRIKVHDTVITAPYWMNKVAGETIDWSFGPFNGKATPFQISVLCEIAIDSRLDQDKIQKYALDHCLKNNIGIDCSGFVYHAISELLLFAQRSHFPHKKQFYPDEVFIGLDGSGKLRRMNANIWTSDKNGYEIDLEEVRCGDLIRMKDGEHVAILYSRDEHSISIAHSTSSNLPGSVSIDKLLIDDILPLSAWRLNLSNVILYDMIFEI